MGHKDDDKRGAAEPSSGADAYEGNELLRIVSTMPATDIDLVRQRVGEMNNFRELSTDALDVLERHHRATVGANSQSQESFHRACQDTREILREVLARDLEWDQQRHVLDLLMTLVQVEGAKDTESKKLLTMLSDKLSSKTAWIAGAAIVATAAAVAVVAPQAARQVGEALRRGPS